MKRILAVLLSAAWLAPGVAAAAECEDWVATVVSVQGRMEARRAAETQWLAVAVGDRYCVGDAIRLRERSRGAVLLRNETVLRLDQNTTITFAEAGREPASWIDLLRGAVHFISRVPRGLTVLTPFVNGTVEGTEFWVEVAADRTTVTVFEGRVTAENAAGRLTLESGQSAVARAGQAPAPFAVVRPRDAVQWTLHYPAVADYRPEDFEDIPGEDWPAMVRRSIDFYRRGDLPMAFASLAPAGPDIRDPRFFTYRAALLLSVGRVDEAGPDIEKALSLDPRHGPALALQSVVAVARNEQGEALRLGRLAVDAAPGSAAAWTALSYAQQARFDLRGALKSVDEAVRLRPENSLAWARLSELRLSLGEIEEALRAAHRAASLNPTLARAQTVLGFAHLADLETTQARQAFERAIQLDQADPLPRLGLGLTRIRQGDLEAGRREIEIAASLDPGSALVRSYLGKAYYEERRNRPAAEEFATAKALDPNDPTPWFYDAIRKQSVNRPVEALHDLQRAIELNDNRAVYRSRFLLDEDLAARSASLARIYDDLGFQQRALVEGWTSVNVDPSNYTAHRFLADSYSVLPRHEIARVSELLQAQLLQPLNINPVQPQLALAKPFILSGAGPARPSFNEFDPLFDRDRVSLLGSGVAGGNETLGDEVVLSGIQGSLSYSLGQFHYETEGFRPNDDLEQDIYNLFTQARLSHGTSVQAELRYQAAKKGDLLLRFDPANFFPDLRQTEKRRSVRLGLRHAFAPGSDVLVSFIYQTGDFDTKIADTTRITTDEEGYTAEVQYLFQSRRLNLISGAGRFNADRTDELAFPFLSQTTDSTLRHTNVYAYSFLNFVKRVTATVGASADFFDGGTRDRDQVNPKAGLTWNPWPATTFRAAAIRTFKRSLVTNQTLEPTQVAGFNQFFDDPEGTDSWRYGVGIDQKLSASLYAGAEVSRRTLEIPFTQIAGTTAQVSLADWKEKLGRAYVYWTPAVWLAISGEYQYERFERDRLLGEDIAEVRTHRFPLGVAVFDPSGFHGRLTASYIDQKGTFADPAGTLRPGADRFWIVDASVGYRLPRRWGLITAEVRNLLDERFRFQDTDPAAPQIFPERLILGRFTVFF